MNAYTKQPNAQMPTRARAFQTIHAVCGVHSMAGIVTGCPASSNTWISEN